MLSNGAGNIVSIMAPDGQKTTFALNANGYLASATDPAGIVTSYNYTSGGLLTSEIDPKGNNHTYSYDNMGILVTDKDAAGGALTLSRTGRIHKFYSIFDNRHGFDKHVPGGDFVHQDHAQDQYRSSGSQVRYRHKPRRKQHRDFP